MTPAASWSPEDYYRASRRARAAWEMTDHQLTLGIDAMLGVLDARLGVLEAADSGTTSLVESAASSASLNRLPCPGDALDTTTREETC